MKKLMFILFFCLQANIFAQNNNQNNGGTLTIFADDGVRFWISVNGERKNAKAASNVKIPTNANSYWKTTIIFENQQLPEITKSVYTSNKGEVVYRVRKNRRGNYVVRLFSAPQDAGLAVENDDNVSHQPIDNKVNNQNNQNNNNQNTKNIEKEKVFIDINGIKTEVKTGENDVQINLPGGINTKIVVPNNDPFENGTWNNNNNHNNNNNQNNQNNNNQNNNNQNNNSNNCQYPMNSADFSKALKSLKSQSFEDTKMSVAKQFTKVNCLSVEQIKSIINEFNFEKTKLDYAKFAHNYCYNKNNYYELNDAFSFDSSVKELTEYLEGK